MATPTEEQPRSRRKACDLCFTKKIKCDMLEPECSNCMLYRAQCRTSIIRSRAKPPKPRPANQSKTTAQGSNTNINARIRTIEERLDEIIENNNRSYDVETGTSEKNAGEVHRECSAWKFNPIQPILYYGPSDENHSLPPLDEIMPVIDHYFRTFNCTTPIFRQSNFMRLVTNWYSKSPKRDKPTWAAILAVIALGLRAQFSGDIDSPSSAKNIEWADSCMRSAQSVIPELVARDEDLLGIQVILSLALLFRNSSDLRPASTLIGVVVKLAHRMQLHCSDSAQHFTIEENQQRSNVFWIIYSLDKDISFRTKTPSALSDADLDVPLPPRFSSDGIGMIPTKDDRHKINIFRLRIDLAYIEGKIYHLLYSGRSTKIQAAEREKRVTNLQTMLDQWYALIPIAFQIEAVSTEVSDADLIPMTDMYHAYLMCIISIHGVYSNRAEWMQKVGSLSKAAIEDFAVALHGPRVTLCTNKQTPPLKGGWNYCVDISRSSMKLFQATPPTEFVIWQCSCAHFSALIIVLANILISPTHSFALLDLQAATESIQLFDKLYDVLQSSAYEPLQRVIKDLHKNAVDIVSGIQPDAMKEVDELAFLNNIQGEMNLLVDEDGFPEIEYNEDQHYGGFEFGGILDTFVTEDI